MALVNDKRERERVKKDGHEMQVSFLEASIIKGGEKGGRGWIKRTTGRKLSPGNWRAPMQRRLLALQPATKDHGHRRSTRCHPFERPSH